MDDQLRGLTTRQIASKELTFQRSATAALSLRRTGTSYGGWTYNATGIAPCSIVYSVGIGEDTSWDEAMLRDHGLEVWGFDPTSKAIDHVHRRRTQQALGPAFHFTNEGLATKQGTLVFTKPLNNSSVSMRQGRLAREGLGEAIEVPVSTLELWMQRNGHTHLDILKIDIEYEVLEDWIRRRHFPMDQLLVEFHNRFLSDKARHAAVLSGLKDNGFDVIHNYNAQGQELTFQRSATAALSLRRTPSPSALAHSTRTP